MGCVTSKQTVPVTPAVDHSGGFRDNAVGGSGRSLDGNGDDVVAQLETKKRRKKKGNTRSESGVSVSELGGSGRTNFTIDGGESVSFRLGNLHRYVEVEHVAAGWPAWLSAVAGEAIHGWLPLRAESFEKLEKIGQGTYSSVFRARDLEAGKIVALKKVRFDNFEPESVRFMAREIVILRRLNHPNIMKLDGIITSQLSCSIYLVFEYMEHDISGLLSCPNIKFTESQIKCYMKQLLSGLKHCHSQGVMHRDIKGANLLVNNEGIIKIGDFGLANFHDRRPLTSKVVTLWYRPPELLLGSTDYEASVDLWSMGCVFAELLLGAPLLQGRTEVEQMHKIFKLCGSPCEDYWKKSKLPHATLFKPQRPYESCLWETFKDIPKNTVNLIETLLSIEPYKRGSASSALASEYFTTKPYACQPSSLPKYPPTKEIDAKHREHSRRKRHVERNREPETSRRFNRNYPNGMCELMPEENLPVRTEVRHKINGISLDNEKESDIIIGFEPRVNKINYGSQGDIPFSGPLQVSGSSGFAWARRRLDDPSSIRSHSRSSSKSLLSEPSREPNFIEKIERISSRGRFDGYPSQDLPISLFKKIDLIYQNQEDKVEFSGPLLSQSHQIDELLERHERQIRQAVRSKKMANNTEIMLAKVKMPVPEMVAAILAMNDELIDSDQIEDCLKFYPTKEEMEQLKKYTGDYETLSKREKYFLELMKVPRMDAKLNVFLFKIQFNVQLTEFKKSLNTVNSACDEVRRSTKLKEIMKRILYLGNTLNQGTARGAAVGFKLDSLLILTDTRASDSKMTLMHYLCKKIASKSPSLLDFHEDLVSLEAATKIELKVLAEKMQSITKGLENAKQELAASANDGPVSEGFHKTLKEFIGQAEAEMTSVTEFYSIVCRNADALAIYFGEDPTRCPFEQATMTLLNFVRLFRKCDEENRKQEAEMEEVKGSSVN